ncbi:Mycothiol-dependent maleylpyruvate isomerase metal-binding domain-containing protein OS=Tsukamurella paurometabola (strain ATCC 8368 / DSM / CCUG 35730/ CIP 100753 / JCM 10117 / KCTC 9821 / NBRC 16120 / NCIMB 702349/ NCTC 13040) OX=521096 GN=Tpau_3084 PE=4 SV=1 [Tsukamurella paurometabola]|uniref:Mycothiol-dependent maleylpyruvate isomerase metal-binding domain-containing protein n=1 Tax=Tsukamurella paurometabola (strain ATCC 8368 / DSM 20162 / CCUG 35730 / CIP 100753 / JCM 10117 / KCTC 9821 / NBRC 16120 / NCIMB 702349 / NCTC 13040) TaxID=521096 RepID=D5UUV8_TSUPD|nr:maleylpyruvate isomerase family mycothiol-dependent enzyme [Tsukamurella paurometabola]ADG79676.1 conserved hypothetical protein [Tsukamurella paurometabola DSM 20162]SUP36717.1 uncharacterized Actinobacterial protein [Tsukamurella paurometabola]
MSDVWPMVHAERRALIDFLSTVDESRWDTPSLCPGWSVRDVTAHQISTAKTTRLGFVRGMITARFDFDRDNLNGVERERGTAAQMLAAFRAVADATATPPAPLDTRLVEAIVHGEDIRRPLGAIGDYPLWAVIRALRLQARTSTAMGGAKQHLTGLRLVADDSDLVFGDGAEVAGHTLALLLAVSGRTIALAELTGSGLAELSSRVGRQ